MRPRTACDACRKRQRRCVHDATRAVACEFCVRNKYNCSLAVTDRYNDAPSHSDGDSGRRDLVLSFTHGDEAGTIDSEVVSPQLPPLDVCVEIASAYFNYIHDPSHNLFHRPSFMTDLAAGAIPTSIILCVLALAARFSKHSFFGDSLPRLRGNIYAREAERQLDLHSISLITLHTALLLGAFYGTEGDSAHENLYYSVACRLGCLLNLPDCMTDSPLNRELSLRLWWTLDMIDVWSSNSLQLPRLLKPKQHVPYPTKESSFLQMRRLQSFSQSLSLTELDRDSDSLLAQKIRLNSLLSDITQLNKASAEGYLTTNETRVATENLAQKLNEWHRALPDSLTNTPENLITQAALGSGGAFVALHVGFYHFSQLLYYHYLHRSLLPDCVTSPTFDEPDDYAERCRDSSTALCELLYAAQTSPGAEVYYSMVGHALFISSTVQLHILLFSGLKHEVQAARRRLERNFLILCSLQNLWKTVDHSLERFREFHQACMKARTDSEDSSDTFRLDKWMLRFLMEYSTPVEKRSDNQVPTPVEAWEQQFAPGAAADVAGMEQNLNEWSLLGLGIDCQIE